MVQTIDGCCQHDFIDLFWLAFFARRTRLTLTSFTRFAWLTRWFGLALGSWFFGFARFLDLFWLALLLGGLGFCACTFFLFVAAATASTTATAGTATAIVAFT